MAIAILKLVDLRTDSHAIFLEGSTGHTVVQSRALALVGGLKLHMTPRTTARKFNDYLGIDMIIKYQLHFRTEQWLSLDKRKALSRPGVFLRPGRARCYRDHFGTDSVRSKFPPLYVPVSPSPVSREASLDLWCSISPMTMVVFKLRTLL